ALLLALSVAACGESGGGAATSQPSATTAAAPEASGDGTGGGGIEETSASEAEQDASEEATAAPTEAAAAPAEDAPASAAAPGEFDGIPGLSKYETLVEPTFARSASQDPNFAPGQNYEKNIWTDEYEQILGIKLNTLWSAEGVDAYNDKLMLSIVAQDIPDVFVCNSAQFASLTKAGMLEDLTGVVEQWATPMVAENLRADGGAGLDQASYQGAVYGLPQASVGAGGMMLLYIREDWRVALGLGEPKTTDDLYAMAKAFADNDMSGTGKTWGLAISNQPFETWFAPKGFFNGFGAYPKQWLLKDGRLEEGMVQPEMKAALAELKRYYDDGLIDPEFVVKGSADVSADAIAGKVGIAFGEWWLQGWPLPDGVKLGQDWRPYEIPYAADTPRKIGAYARLGGRYVVRKGYEHPEALVKMYNLFQERVMSQKYDTNVYKTDGVYDFQGLAAIQPVIGIDRNNYNGKMVTPAVEARDPSLLEPGNADQLDNYNRVIGYLDGLASGKYEGINPGNISERLTPEEIDEYSLFYTNWRSNAGPDSIIGLLDDFSVNGKLLLDRYYSGDTPGMVTYSAQLQSNAEEMIVNIVSGAAPIGYFDEFVANWKASGGDEITAEVNEWYSAQ
ncbi:MAG: extracellular solute-binding protein, partial [Clostridiales bacterium]|nr:extracellular solute-binding protein [Clostridiales bacterium]